MCKKHIEVQGDLKMTDSDSTPILIEFSPRPGVEAVAIFNTNTEEIRRKSEEALNNAMKKIEEMALVGGSARSNGVSITIRPRSGPHRPTSPQ